MRIRTPALCKDGRALLRFAMILLVLLLLCVGSAWSDLYTNSQNTVTVGNTDALPVSVKDHAVEQPLILEGALKQVRLYMAVPNRNAYGNAAVEFAVTQGERCSSITVAADEITGDYVVPIKLKGFSAGEAVLTVSGTAFPQETDMFLSASQGDTGLLPAATMDGSGLPGPIVMHYTVMRHDGYFVYDTVLLTLLVAIIIGVAWMLAFYRERVSSGRELFLCSFLLLFLYISLTNPLATFLAEPHSEMAYEFWYKAKYYSFGRNLMSLMSGESLVWTERLMMWLAVQLAGDGKYVFVIAQVMQTLLVCGVSSMLCLPTFRRWFPAELRLLVCWYLGGAMLFPSAYYFWGVSYWACFFLIPFAFVDMEKLPQWQYILAMVCTVILCVSRIYHILLIPIALLALVCLGKLRGKRFSLYCVIVAGASLFEVVYSMSAGGSGHLDLGLLKPIQFMENALYYQVQVLKSLALGDASVQSELVNAVFFVVFLSILAYCLIQLIQWKNQARRGVGCLLMVLGILSFGSILINVTVCGCSASVGFPIDYAVPVDWSTTFYQNADFHFSYSYFSVLGILLTFFALAYQKYMSNNKELIINCVGSAVLACFAAVNVHTYLAVRQVPTDWKSSYQVTLNESYYLPINISYYVANISLCHNSGSILCGVGPDGDDVLWNPSVNVYGTQTYTKASPGKVSDLSNRKMLSLSVARSNISFSNLAILVLFDKQGNELAQVMQSNDPTRLHIDFLLPEAKEGVYSVAFQDVEGQPLHVSGGMQIGVSTLN